MGDQEDLGAIPINKCTKRVTRLCCVPQCHNKPDGTLAFHQFPKASKNKQSWEIALRMGKPASDSMRVCSAHFLPTDYFPGAEQKTVKRLKANTVSSQKIPMRSHDRHETTEKSGAKRKRLERSVNRSRATQKKEESSSAPEATGENADHEELMQSDMDADNTIAARSQSVDASTQTSENFVPRNLEEQLSRKATIIDMLSEVEMFKNFTGLHSFELLDTLVECVQDLVVDNKRVKEMSTKNRIILTFTRLKLNLSFTTLAILFGITRQTCSNYFKDMIPMLSIVLETMIPWPDHEDLKMNIPIAFKNYSNTRIVLDCAETPIDKSKCLKCRILTWSNYKGKQTAKFDVGVSPSGLITHISKAYGGRASDKLIVMHSGVLDKLVCHDAVMTDKGFKIEQECLVRNLFLHRPPFVYQKKQMIRADAIRCAEIARARVHVERVIQRMRTFNFLSEPVPWELIPYVDDVLIIVAGIVNLGPPVLNIDKFM